MCQGKRSLIKLAGLILVTLVIGLIHYFLLKNLVVRAQNTGISFGITLPWLKLLLVGLLMAGSWSWVYKSNSWAFGIVLAGGWVNCWDRISFGYVHDYWKIPMVEIYNNIADWMIFVGIMVLLIEMARKTNGNRKKYRN